MTVRRVVPNLVSPDMDGSRAFYEEFLGFKLVMDLGWIVTYGGNYPLTVEDPVTTVRLRDQRRGRRRRWAVGERTEWDMRIYEEQLRKTVAFLWVDVADEDLAGAMKRVPGGTAFFVRYPLERHSDVSPLYVVTAAHVINCSRPHDLFLRLNLNDGAAYVDVPASQDAWTLHPETDIAVARLRPDPTADIVPIDIGLFATWRESEPATPPKRFHWPWISGDDVALAGLLVGHPGSGRNEPVLRFGRVALMPSGPVEITMHKDGPSYQVDAVLIEAASWGGQSGSPVFVERENGPGPELLGVLHGHVRAIEAVKLQPLDVPEVVNVNSGISIVIPAQKIIEVLLLDELVEERQAMDNLLDERQPAVVPDMPHITAPTQRTDKGLEIPIPTREDVQGAFKKITRSDVRRPEQ